MVYFNYITNPFQPNKGRICRALKGKMSVWDLIKSQKVDLSRPTICFIDGLVVLRKDWNFLINPSSIVSLVTLPQGGGGGKSSNPVQVVLTVAVIVA